MSDRARPRAPEVLRFGWREAPAAVVLLLLGLSPGGTGPASLPDSVTPCVPCHGGGKNDQVAQWQASPYSEREGGRGCTDCHVRYCSGNEAPRARTEELAAKRPPGPTEAARLTVIATCTREEVTAEVAVSNVGVGHLLPTGSPERRLILEVAAHDRHHAPLPLREDPRQLAVRRATAGLSGRGSANGAPTVAAVIVQPRLRPFATDVSRYRFDAPESGPVRVSARLVLVPVDGPPREIASSASVCRPSGAEP